MATAFRNDRGAAYDLAPSHPGETRPLALLAQRYLDTLIARRRHEATAMIMEAVDGGLSIENVYLDVFQPALWEVGRLWQICQLTVAQEHYITAVTQSIMSQLYPRIFRSEGHRRIMVACCVSGELHEVGARMVADCFEMSGWDSHYLGANIPASDVVDTALAVDAEVIAISATLSSHLGLVEDLVNKAHARLGGKATILVGGYPFNRDKDLWRKLGADGSAHNAAEAVMIAERGGCP
jgi:methylmalonyl-CoA mutase cobalamin-binding domain/chain